MGKVPFAIAVASMVPFVALSVAISLQLFPDPKFITGILLTYAAVILSFLGGIHWGIAVHQYTDNRKLANMLIIESILPALLAWAVLLNHDIHIELLILALLFTFVWAVDSLLFNNNMLPQWFFNLRCIVTPVVVVSLYVAYFGLI